MKRLALALLLTLGSCDPIQLGDGERRIVAQELVANVVLPTHDDVVVQVTALANAIHAGNDDSARAAWRTARAPWKQTGAFAFGPATDLRIGVAMDGEIDRAKIDEELAATTTFSAAYVANLGANKKGFHAIEYLLFDPPPGISVRARELLPFLADDLVANATKLRDAWTSSYGELVGHPGDANADYPTIQSVIDSIVNESVFLVELVAKARLGKPLGLDIGGTPQPELEESGPSDASIDDMRASIAGARNVYDAGITKLVRAQSPSTDRAVHDAFDAADAALAAIPHPFRDALVSSRATVEEAYARVIALKRVLGTEILAVLGATLKFNDNDGD